MNPKIKELAEQSWVDNFGPEGFMDPEKFAELIIQECIGVVENLSPGYNDYRDQIEDAFRRDCIEEMKAKFFGETSENN